VRIEVLYFAGLREAVGTARESVELPPGVATAGALRAWLRARGGAWAEALADGRTLRVAVDQAMAGADAPLRDGAEVAFFPPVTGG
jgi:molybdopterin synthase sulfur carrier subunit